MASDTSIVLQMTNEKTKKAIENFEAESQVNLMDQPLKPAENMVRPPLSKIHNENRYRYYEFRLEGSVLPSVAVYVSIATIWASLICILYFVVGIKQLAVSNFIISILSIVVGLTLVFRTNTAYDRYWEARKLWATLKTHCRNLARYLFIVRNTENTTPKDIEERIGAINLLTAMPVSIKHQLRQEKGVFYEDLYPLLCHLPEFCNPDEELEKIPLEISFQLSHLISKMRAKDHIDTIVMAQMLTALSGCMDVLSNLERIRNSPLPLAYSIHLRQTVLLYILTLPFQLMVGLGWATIPVVAFSAFTLLGIESIGTEIEQPFGYDANDLRLDMFCDDIKNDMVLMLKRAANLNSSQWLKPRALQKLPSMYDATH